MELENVSPIITTKTTAATPTAPKPVNNINCDVGVTSSGTTSSPLDQKEYGCRSPSPPPPPSSSLFENGLCSTRYESFRKLENYLPKIDHSAQLKLSWLRSQIIGGDVEFDSPFGSRRVTYADHTASGRSLQYIESFIIDNVLPFYGTVLTFILYIRKIYIYIYKLVYCIFHFEFMTSYSYFFV